MGIAVSVIALMQTRVALLTGVSGILNNGCESVNDDNGLLSALCGVVDDVVQVLLPCDVSRDSVVVLGLGCKLIHLSD